MHPVPHRMQTIKHMHRDNFYRDPHVQDQVSHTRDQWGTHQLLRRAVLPTHTVPHHQNRLRPSHRKTRGPVFKRRNSNLTLRTKRGSHQANQVRPSGPHPSAQVSTAVITGVDMKDSLCKTLTCGKRGIGRKRKQLLLARGVFSSNAKAFSVQRTTRSFTHYVPPRIQASGPIIRVSLGPRPSSHLSSTRLTTVTRRCLAQLNCNGRPCTMFGRRSVNHRRLRVMALSISRAKQGVNSDFLRHQDGGVAHTLRRRCKLRATRHGQRARVRPLHTISTTTNSIGGRVKGMLGNVSNGCHFRALKRCHTLLTLCGTAMRRYHKRIQNQRCNKFICSTLSNRKGGINAPVGTSHFKGHCKCITFKE